jgi:hypothetical protein
MGSLTAGTCRQGHHAEDVMPPCAECRPDQPTDWAAMGHVASLLGISTAETLRKWVRQDQIDQGHDPGSAVMSLPRSRG